MSVHTQKNNVLTLKIDDGKAVSPGGQPNLLDVSCQVIDLKMSLPGEGSGNKVLTACADGVVLEPGDPVDGSLTGTVFADTTDTGVTWLLMQAFKDGKTVSYELDWWPDLGATIGVKVTGEAKVNSLELDWAKPGFGKHPLDLALKTATIAHTP